MPDDRELEEDKIKEVGDHDDDIGILTPEDHEEVLETTSVTTCYVSTIYFQEEKIAALAHLSASTPIGVFAKKVRDDHPNLVNGVCEYTVIDGVYSLPYETAMKNRDPSAIASYFPKARPSPYHPLEVSTVLDVVSINKNTGVVKADG